jgi:hypothetical protein
VTKLNRLHQLIIRREENECKEREGTTMKIVTGKKETMKRRMLYLASMLMIGLLIFGFASYAMASEGEESAQNSVSTSDSSSGGGSGEPSGDTGSIDTSGGSNDGSSDASGNESVGDSGDSGDPAGSGETGDTNGSGGSNSDGVTGDGSGTSDDDGTGDTSGAQGSDDMNGTGEQGDANGSGDSNDDGVTGDDSDISNDDSSSEQGGADTNSNGDTPMMTALGEQAPETPPTGTPTPETVTVPEYQIPEGSAYVIGSEDTVYKNTATQNAIQQAIDAAKATAASKVTIIVNNGVYTGGITLVVPAPTEEENGEGSSEPVTKMILEIIASDAYTKNDETGEITANANSAGGVETEGTWNFDGVDVLLAGIYLSLRDKVTVKNADNVTYYGTSLDDDITLELDQVKDNVTIDTGDGDDVLDLSVKQSPTVSITLDKESGFDADGNLTDDGKAIISNLINDGVSKAGGSSRLKAVIKGGKGDDKITITLINSTDISTENSPSETEPQNTTINQIKADLDLSAVDLTVEGEAGADTITIDGGMELGLAAVILQPFLQQIMSETTASVAAATGLPGTEIKINGGAGDDLINVDTTVSFSSFRGVDVTVDGGSAYDRTNLTGKLQEYKADDPNISGNASQVEMSTLAEINILNDSAAISRLNSDLSVTMVNVEAVTDELINKNSVYINDLLADKPDFASFTDYVIDNPSGTVNYENTNGSGTFLSNLIIKGSDLTIGTVNTPNVNIIIKSTDSGLNDPGSVTITGTVTGKNIFIKVKKTDSHALEIIENDLGEEEDDYELDASLFDIVSDATIIIEGTGSLIAAQTVNLEAISEQTKPLIPTLEELTEKLGVFGEGEDQNPLNINFVAVKVGKAIIDIKGKIEAAAIRAIADSLVNVSAMNDNLADFGLPLAVGVVVSEAGIVSDGSASLKAKDGGILLKADSDVTLDTHAVSGLLPFVLAVSVVVNDAYVDIKGGTTVNSEGDTIASASGNTSITTSASGPKPAAAGSPGSTGTTPQTAGKSGGFFAVSVAIQDVFVSITENASADSQGELILKSTAIERVKNKAASNPDDGGTSFSLSNLITKINSLLTKTSTNPNNTNTRGNAGLTGAVSRLSGTNNQGGTSTGVSDLVNTGTAGSTGTVIPPTPAAPSW